MSEVDLDAVRKLSSAQLGKFVSLEEFLSFAIQAQHRLIQLTDEVERLRKDDKRLRGDLHRKLGNQIGPEIFKAKHLLCSSCSGKGTGLVCSKCTDDSADMEWTLRAERNRLREALKFYANRSAWADPYYPDNCKIARAALHTDDPSRGRATSAQQESSGSNDS